MAVSISKILDNSELSLKQFSEEAIKALEARIQEKDLGEGVKPYAQCVIRDKEIMMKPEEIVRQLFAEKLMNEFGYPKEDIVFEHPVKSVGRDKENTDFADIVVFSDSTKSQAYIIFEIKRPNEKDLKEQKKQLESYCRVEGASLGALINGDDIEKYYINNTDEKSKTRNLQEISVLPKYGEDLCDILKGERQTLKYLIKHDRLRTDTLKTVITDLETTPKDRDETLKTGVVLLKTNDIRNNILVDKGNDYFYISESTNNSMLSSQLQSEDILINIVGATTEVVGRVSIVPKGFKKTNITQAMSFIRLSDKRYSPYYLFAFLQSKFGQKQTRRIARPTGQYNINNIELGSYKVPLLDSKIQAEIETLILSAQSQLEQAKTLYNQAINKLLFELGLEDFNPFSTLCTTKSLKDFCKSGRLDSEYYQSKYDELFAVLRKNDYKTIRELQTINYRGSQPEYVENGDIDVVNSKHILEEGLDYENFEKTDVSSYNKVERSHISYGDILIYTTGANIGRTQVYLSDKKAIASNHVNILRVEDINPIYLALVLNSKIGRMQTERSCTGTAQAEIYPDDIADFIVPVLSEELQNEIASLVVQSLECKQQSRLLQQSAIQMVEEVIEKYRVN